jgi:hypothetical protein
VQQYQRLAVPASSMAVVTRPTAAPLGGRDTGQHPLPGLVTGCLTAAVLHGRLFARSCASPSLVDGNGQR